jgi:DNA segregation ATPase FtsK/SpoIIIE, S-DNA-T family
VKWFYIEADDDTGYDAAHDIIARAMTTLHPAITSPTGHDEPVSPVRDLLDDIAAVLGTDRGTRRRYRPPAATSDSRSGSTPR